MSAPEPKIRPSSFEAVLPQLTSKSIDFIHRQTAAKPFFLYFALNAPHTPIAPAAQFKGKSQAGDYGDYVVEVDWVVGEILKTLDQQNMAENTLVIVTSDNGPEILAYQRAKENRHYSMGIGGVSSAMSGRWAPRPVPSSLAWQRSNQAASATKIICETDLMATLAAILGAKLPQDAGEDSYNILPALQGESRSHPIREATRPSQR